jgi:hypothetical protein
LTLAMQPVLANILVMMARIMADSELEARIETLEQRGRH